MKHIASVSFGKDSLAMVLRIIEIGMPLDEVVFYDTGMEFDCIYKNRDKLLPILKAKGIVYTELKPKQPFLYKMLEHKRTRGENIGKCGYDWCGGRCRWGTTEKIQALEKYCKGHIEYVGIAHDETERLEKERKGNKVFPLADWGWVEKRALRYCYKQGWNWEEDGVELYDILDRVSCWCCGNKNLKELRNYYHYLPKYWEKLKELQSKICRPFKAPHSIFDLEKRFANGLEGETK